MFLTIFLAVFGALCCVNLWSSLFDTLPAEINWLDPKPCTGRYFCQCSKCQKLDAGAYRKHYRK